ncbi:hypothetical protein QEH59_00830 [Coraliomargarita sp. SDUM461004]|uniref:HTH lacI-type domain-containing protein n=1 Tax=Thalassobacterium sedimentorum TaxID=3041258 RepID=A0ABU1AEL6_9BACT|nr:hypothetical protein [Coraliomargarita sp. SDUM461004]MDQ8192949.1 hypothetical protein [Coraliomargarita sp. SDUM461004]
MRKHIIKSTSWPESLLRRAAHILAGESPRSKSWDKVFGAAKQLGYVRNQLAANLRSGSSSVIGIIVSNINTPFYGKVV